jgi:hypothetical protein
MLTGGCYCGAIRYWVRGMPVNAINCHCSVCRRTTGARGFCARGGTQLAFRADAIEEIAITTCSLDDPDPVPPTDNSRTCSQLSWIPPDGRHNHLEALGG